MQKDFSMQVKAKSQDNGAGPDLHIECRSGSRRENESGSMLIPDAKFGIRFYLTPGFVMFELRRTLLFEKNLV